MLYKSSLLAVSCMGCFTVGAGLAQPEQGSTMSEETVVTIGLVGDIMIGWLVNEAIGQKGY